MSEQTPTTEEVKKLTVKQRAFVDAYLGAARGVGIDAARLAGYKGNDVTLTAIASENLRKPLISEEIKQRTAALFSEVEVIQRLADHARGSMADFIEVTEEEIILSEQRVGQGETEKVIISSIKRPVARLNLKRAAELGKLHLIKKYSLTRQGESIELYDSHAALVDLGNRLGMFRQGPAGSEDDPLHSVQHSVDEWKQRAVAQRQEAETTMAAFGDGDSS